METKRWTVSILWGSMMRKDTIRTTTWFPQNNSDVDWFSTSLIWWIFLCCSDLPWRRTFACPPWPRWSCPWSTWTSRCSPCSPTVRRAPQSWGAKWEALWWRPRGPGWSRRSRKWWSCSWPCRSVCRRHPWVPGWTETNQVYKINSINCKSVQSWNIRHPTENMVQ